MKTSNLLHIALFSLTSALALGCGPSLGSMHELATAGAVQQDAPLHAHQRVTIHAPRERVWSVLAGFAQWPTWQPNVSQVSPPRTLSAGETFTWKNGTSEITSQLARVMPVEQLAWTGSVSTAKAIHVWRLTAPTEDTTVVDVEETMDGFLLTWFYGQKDLDAEMARSLANLTRAAEAPAR